MLNIAKFNIKADDSTYTFVIDRFEDNQFSLGCIDTATHNSTFKSFSTAEAALSGINSFIEKHNAAAELIDEGAVTISQREWITATGIKHEVKLVAWSNVFHAGRQADITYRITHSWGELEDDTICNGNYGFQDYEAASFATAMDLFSETC